MSVYNPQMQVKFTLDIRRTYLGKAPSLGLVAKAYNFGVAKSWVAIQLWDLAEFSGSRQKMTSKQIDELTQLICVTYGYMKLTELMDFFRRFKLGEYGRFYGSVDPMVITLSLKEFSIQRFKILRHLEASDAEKLLRSDARYVAQTRAMERKAAMLRFYSANFRSSVFTVEEFEEVWWLFNLGYERQDHGYRDRP